MIKKLMMTMCAFLVFSANANALELTDVDGHWAEDTITEYVNNGVINGFPDKTFRPSDSLTKEQFVKLLLKAEGHDLPIGENYWSENYINKAKELGYMYEDEINYSIAIYRMDTARISSKSFVAKDNFRDYATQIKDYEYIPLEYREAVLKHYSAGIMTGYDDKTIGFKNKLTRAEGIVVLDRIINESKRKVVSLNLSETKINELKKYEQNTELSKYYEAKDANFIDFDAAYISLGEKVYEFIKTAEKYTKLHYEFDYTEGNSNFEMLYYGTYGTLGRIEDEKEYSANEYKDFLYNELVENEVKVTGAVVTYPSLAYISKNGTIRLRAVLTYKYTSHKDRKIDKNKQIEKDIEIDFVLDAEGYPIVNKVIELN